MILAAVFLFFNIPYLLALSPRITHHPRPIQFVAREDEQTKPLVVENLCSETIYPGIATSAGTPPSSSGFRLEQGETRSFDVSPDWQGRVWARTNCSFNAAGTGPSVPGGINGDGQACVTGDCFGVVECATAGRIPVSLAEFTYTSASSQAYYDISLVDGYNIPIAIISLYPSSRNSSLQAIPPNLTNPICIGTASHFASPALDVLSGTNATFPIPLLTDEQSSLADVIGWCPWDLQLSIPKAPSDGVYTYPDSSTSALRAIFNPCYSACAKYNRPADCCTGRYNDPLVCRPSTYSADAKKVCPDAYSYAFDDQTSTFIIPSGGGFQVTFCPTGRSSNILAVFGEQMIKLAQTGRVDAGETAA